MRKIEAQIMEYLHKHPTAMESLEHIAENGVPGEASYKVARAMQHLVKKGLVRRQGTGRETLYHRGSYHHGKPENES